MADLRTGIISNDGLGGRDTLRVTDGGDRIELQGTNLADSILGSDAGERFILNLDADTLDGGGGTDLLRYDRNGVTSVNADLEAGLVTGIWNGAAFSHAISNIEDLSGSRDGNDTLRGDDGDNRLEARRGDDLMRRLAAMTGCMAARGTITSTPATTPISTISTRTAVRIRWMPPGCRPASCRSSTGISSLPKLRASPWTGS